MMHRHADMVEAQHNALTGFSADDSIGAILVEGTPKAFCAGAFTLSEEVANILNGSIL